MHGATIAPPLDDSIPTCDNWGQAARSLQEGHKGMVKLEINAFNRFSVSSGEEYLNIGPVHQRALLALLTIHRNEMVTMDAIIDSLWLSAPPSQPRKSVQAYVSRLRRILSCPDLVKSPSIQYFAPGYILRIDPAQVTTDRFEKLTARGRGLLHAGRVTEASESFTTAFALWDDAPYGDLSRYEFAVAETTRLEEVRLTSVAGQAECLLKLGDHGSAADLLAPAVNRYPLREDLAATFMVALKQSDRRADALSIYERTRSSLGELGIKVGGRLHSVYQTIVA